MQRDRLPYLLIPLAACIAILPLILNGCSCGHDFDFHLLNWMEAARQFTHANLHPHWAYTAAYNAGEPRFVFYPPLSWTLGAVLTLLFPITATPILYTWLALSASGLALHFLAREFTPPTPALLAAILYTVNPYMLFTAYERTAYAELLAAAFIPLLLPRHSPRTRHHPPHRNPHSSPLAHQRARRRHELLRPRPPHHPRRLAFSTLQNA